ncbi:MAG: hypothetical protein ACP5D7_21905 [Limnospira sp.]
MTCQTDRYGRPRCHITAHPDRPHDQFCSACGKQFHPVEKWNDIIVVILAVLALLVLTLTRLQQPSRTETSIPSIDNAESVIPR